MAKNVCFDPKARAGQLLRLLDRTVRFQQASRARRRSRRSRRGRCWARRTRPCPGSSATAGDRLAAADRHGVEDAGRLLGIFHQRGEERRLVARLHAAQDVQVQLHEVFLIVEDPAADAEVEPGDILDRAFGDEIGVELGAHLGDQAAQLGPVILADRRSSSVVAAAGPCRGTASGSACSIFGLQRQAGAHDDGLDVVVEQHRDQRVLEARHHHRSRR